MSMVYFNEQLKKYCKICPSCQKDIPYSTKKSAKRFDTGVSLCRSCAQKLAKKKLYENERKGNLFGISGDNHPKFIKMEGIYGDNQKWSLSGPPQ